MRIEVRDIAVEQKSGVARESKKPYTIRTQTAWVQVNGETRRIALNLEEGQSAYEIGVYALADESFYVGDYGRLMVGRLVLRKAAAASAATSRVA